MHYQFLEWPDHDVPDDPASLVSVIEQLHDEIKNKHMSGPWIVHCRFAVMGFIIIR